ncbi:MAG TPA: hypothetical protein VFR85_02230 [Anaeromyxobacteraceae bacterium]|nr:hypothetical protein [Anaeromyxobacteraceae bacterium]
MRTFHLFVVLFAAYMLVRHGRRAALFLAPSLVRSDGDGEAPPATPALARAGDDLERLGFVRLGARRETGALGGLNLVSDGWVNEPQGTYADVFAHAPRGGGAPWAYFLSPFADGAIVLTANHPRLARSTDRVRTGGLPGASLDATWAAHRSAVERFAARHGQPGARADLGARAQAARAWYRGPGRPEIRRLFLVNFVNALFAVVIGAFSARALAGALL